MEQINSFTMLLNQLKPSGTPVICPQCGIEWFKLGETGKCIDCEQKSVKTGNKQVDLTNEIKKYIMNDSWEPPKIVGYEIKDSSADKLLHYIKQLHGIPIDSRRWNDKNYARAVKRSKEILKQFESSECKIKNIDPYRIALRACKDIVTELTQGGMSWTSETILARSDDWERQIVRYGKYIKHQYGG